MPFTKTKSPAEAGLSIQGILVALIGVVVLNKDSPAITTDVNVDLFTGASLASNPYQMLKFERVLFAIFEGWIFGRKRLRPKPVRDLDAIRAFLTGAGPIAIVDLPWVPVFLTTLFPHPPPGSGWRRPSAPSHPVLDDPPDRTRQPGARLVLAQDAGRRQIMVEAQRRGGETIMSMGMAGALAQRNRAPAVQYCRVFGRPSFRGSIAANT